MPGSATRGVGGRRLSCQTDEVVDNDRHTSEMSIRDEWPRVLARLPSMRNEGGHGFALPYLSRGLVDEPSDFRRSKKSLKAIRMPQILRSIMSSQGVDLSEGLSYLGANDRLSPLQPFRDHRRLADHLARRCDQGVGPQEAKRPVMANLTIPHKHHVICEGVSQPDTRIAAAQGEGG